MFLLLTGGLLKSSGSGGGAAGKTLIAPQIILSICFQSSDLIKHIKLSMSRQLPASQIRAVKLPKSSQIRSRR